MHHYICKGGCKGISEKSGVCQTSNCPHHNQSLEVCDCIDNKHHGAFEEKIEEVSEKEHSEGQEF